MKRVGLFVVLLLAGCGGADPCEGLAGCITARVEGNVVGLDSLRVTLGGGQMMLSSPGGTFDLPVRLAIVLPAGTTSPATITVDGLAGGAQRGSSGAQSVPFSPAGKSAFTFTLAPGNGDGGAGDSGLDGPPPGVVSFFPATVDYGSTSRGTAGANKSVTLTNNTDHTVAIMGDATPTGDGDQWIPSAGTTCFSLDAGMHPAISVPAGSSCVISFQFLPSRSGNLQMNVAATFDDGETAGFSLTGKSLRAWSAETSGGTSIASVWGSGPADLWGAGTTPVFHSTGNGSWSALGSNVGTMLYSIFGVDATHVFIAVDGQIYFSNGSAQWSQQNPPTTTVGFPLSGWARDATTAFAVTDAPNPQILSLSGSSWSTVLASPAAHPFLAICGSGLSNVAVGTNAMVYATDVNHAFQNLGAVLGTYVSTLRGCWMSDANNAWLVGDAGGGIIGIFRCSFSGSAWTCAHETAGTNTNNLNAVAGRIDPGNNMPDLYAVGPLGNLLLHSDGSGTWTPITLPTGSALTSVWVAANGDVIAGGANGQIVHLY